MSSGAEAPGYVEPNLLRQFDPQLVMNGLNRARNGISAEERSAIEGRFGALNKEQQQSMQESFAGQNIPLATKIGLMNNSRNSLGKDLQETILNANAQARNEGFSQYATLQGLAGQQTGMMNQYNMGKYQTDKQNEFSWGDALGGFLSAGGQVGGAAMMKPKG